MSQTLTKEILVDAIQKSKATTISGVWRHLGHQSAISGGQSKRIKELVPNHLELLDANKNGTVVTAEKTTQPVAQVAKPQTVVVPKQVTPPAPKKAKGAGGFRNGSGYSVLFAEGNKGYTTMKELISRVAKITGKSETVVKFGYYVMSNTTHKSNGGRAKVIEKDGKVQIVTI